MAYETLRLFNGNYYKKREQYYQNLGKSIPEVKLDDGKNKKCRIDYKNLKYVSVGCNKIDEDIWEASLLGQLKKQNTKIDLAACITMYSEDWKEFESTIRGIV